MRRARKTCRGALLCAVLFGAAIAIGSATADDTGQHAPAIASGDSASSRESANADTSQLDREAARRLIELLQNLSSTGALSSPLYVERHLPHQRPPRGDASSDELARLGQGTIARGSGAEPFRCKTAIATGSSADLDGDGIAGSLDARIDCGLRSDTQVGELSARLRERDVSDTDWQPGFDQELELRVELRPIGDAVSASKQPLAGHQITETQRSVTVRRLAPDTGVVRFEIEKTDRYRVESRGAAGEVVRDDELVYELRALAEPESSQRGRSVDYAIDGIVTSLNGTLRLATRDPETAAMQERTFQVDAGDLQYRARRSSGRRCFFQPPYHGTIRLSDLTGNQLELIFDLESCKPGFAYNGEALVVQNDTAQED